MTECPWYISSTAVREYMQIGNLSGPPEESNPDWRQAERELIELCSSDAVRRAGVDRLGAEVWRTGRVPVGRLEKTIRLELSVVTTPRREGPKPQLVRVRAKDSNRGAGRQERRSS